MITTQSYSLSGRRCVLNARELEHIIIIIDKIEECMVVTSGKSLITFFFVWFVVCKMIDPLEKNRSCSKLNGMLRQCISILMQFFNRLVMVMVVVLFFRSLSHIIRKDRTYDLCTTMVTGRNNYYCVQRRWRFKLVL